MTLLVSATVKVSVLALAALAATGLMQRCSAAMRHFVLAASLLCAMCLPALEALLPVWSVQVPVSWLTPVPNSSIRLVSASEVAGGPTRAAAAADGGSTSPLRGGIAAYTRAVMWVWILGVIAGLGVLAAGVVRIRGLALHSEPAQSGTWHRIADEVARAYGLSRPVRLLHSAQSAMLVTWGTLRPTVLLPTGARDWPDERIRVVLYHELAHVRRRDWMVTLAATVLKCVYWFNPLVWIACHRLRHESELACDDLVLRSGVSGRNYATHLLAVARESTRRQRMWSPATAMAHHSTLEGRVRVMLNANVNRHPLTARARAIMLALFLTAALPLAAVSVSGNAGTPDAPIHIVSEPAPLPVVPEPAQPADTRSLRVATMAAHAAQTEPGTIEGVLYDQFGGLLPGATVTLTHVETGGRYEAASDRGGRFSFGALPSGNYELTTGLIGFTTVKNVISVVTGEHVLRHITLPLGSLEEVIRVTCGEPLASPSQPAPTAPRVRQQIKPTATSLFSGGIGGQIRVPRKLVHVNPRCPAGIPNSPVSVVLAGRVGIDGLLTDLRDVSTSSATAVQREYVASALNAARQWEFNATLLNGAPIEANITITVDYSWPN